MKYEIFIDLVNYREYSGNFHRELTDFIFGLELMFHQRQFFPDENLEGNMAQGRNILVGTKRIESAMEAICYSLINRIIHKNNLSNGFCGLNLKKLPGAFFWLYFKSLKSRFCHQNSTLSHQEQVSGILTGKHRVETFCR